MSGLEENIKELIILSNLIRKQDFKTSFVEHFADRVRQLGSVPSKIDVKISQKLQLKLLDPLLFHLNITTTSKDKYVLIQCIIEVLKIALIHSADVFLNIYTAIFFQIFQSINLTYQPSEELKECVLECATVLIKNSNPSVLEEVYDQAFGAKFSLGIYVSVNIIKEEKSFNLRIAALNFLLASSKFENSAGYTDQIFSKIGDLFMLYLPGILAPLLEVIMRNETQHHLITAKALTCWGHILCLVMRDSEKNEKPSESETVKQWLATQKGTYGNNIKDISKGLQEKKRTKLWLESAALTLHPLIIKLSDVRKHSHPKCRLELILMMVKILKYCLRNLRICLPVLTEVLVSSVVDEDEEVRLIAEKTLNEFDIECDTIFVPVLEENLYSVINRLPNVIQSGSEEFLLLSLKSLSGYLRILGKQNRLQHLISLSSTLQKIISVIKISFELEVYPEISTQDFSLWENEMDSLWWKPWKRFRHFNSEAVKNQLEDICRDLGKFCQSEAIFDFLLETHDEYFSFRKEILLILNEVILGSRKIEDQILCQLLDFYLKPENLFLPLQVNENDCIDPREAQTNIIKVALTMEGIKNLAKNTGENFQGYLLKSLYFVLQQMGSSFSIIRHAATQSAVEIANACGLDGKVKVLIESNIDYLTYHLTVKLRKHDESALDVVTVLVKNCTLQTMPNLEEIISRVLKSSSQNFNSHHTLSYLKLFQIFVVCVTKWMKVKKEAPVSNVQPKSHADRLMKYLDKLSTGETKLEVPETEEMSRGTEPQETFDHDPKKPKLPRHLKLTLMIANHCLHYLASRDRGIKIVVLEILNECLWALADWEDDLLPLVHNIWSPLITKFESTSDPLVINRSFKLLCTMSFTSRDFVRARTLKNVLPALESFLIKQAVKSKLKDSASGYLFTQNFKLQRELLNYLGKLTLSIGLFERQTDLVIHSALPYLSSLQPRELQGKCHILFEDLKIYDGQLVWYKVHNFIENSEFAKNVFIVLRTVK